MGVGVVSALAPTTHHACSHLLASAQDLVIHDTVFLRRLWVDFKQHMQSSTLIRARWAVQQPHLKLTSLLDSSSSLLSGLALSVGTSLALSAAK